MVDPSVLDRLRKLQALADRPGTPEEGRVAKAKIEELKQRYTASSKMPLEQPHPQANRPAPTSTREALKEFDRVWRMFEAALFRQKQEELARMRLST